MKLLVFTALMCALNSPLVAATKPNILLILADDMGFSGLGCYGAEIATPNLGRLASGGLRFTSFYRSSFSPGRASAR